MEKFKKYACNEGNSNWERLTERFDDLYIRKGDPPPGC